jgi:hypothetical protein
MLNKLLHCSIFHCGLDFVVVVDVVVVVVANIMNRQVKTRQPKRMNSLQNKLFDNESVPKLNPKPVSLHFLSMILFLMLLLLLKNYVKIAEKSLR